MVIGAAVDQRVDRSISGIGSDRADSGESLHRVDRTGFQRPGRAVLANEAPIPFLGLARGRQKVGAAEFRETIGEETLRRQPLDAEFRRLLAQYILGGDIGETAALERQDVMNAM